LVLFLLLLLLRGDKQLNYREKALITFKALLGATMMFLLFEPKVLVAQGSGTLLYDHFGVTLQLQSPHSGGTNYSFDWNSFALR